MWHLNDSFKFVLVADREDNFKVGLVLLITTQIETSELTAD